MEGNNYVSVKKTNADIVFERVKNDVDDGDQFAITDLYIAYKMIAFKYISKYLCGQDDKNFCYDIAFTETIQKTKLSEITCAFFITRLLGFCKHHACHDIRHRKSCKEKFNESAISRDNSLYESGENNNVINRVEISKQNIENNIIIKEHIEEIMKVVETYKHTKAKECFKLMYIEGYDSNYIMNKLKLSKNSVRSFANKVRQYLIKRGFRYSPDMEDDDTIRNVLSESLETSHEIQNKIRHNTYNL